MTYDALDTLSNMFTPDNHSINYNFNKNNIVMLIVKVEYSISIEVKNFFD